jgi:RNA polymerase sigma-70 factor, ECF subfamily
LSPETDARLSGLLRAALGGDEAAYDRFLRDVAGLVRAAALGRLGSSSEPDPEDVVQETLLAIHMKRHTWRQDEPVGPWVHAIARYKIVDVFRRRGRVVTVDIDDFSNSLAGEDAPVVHERDIERALQGLTDGQRQVVSAISLEGRSIAETAERLDMKENAVRVALHRGLAAIATRFGKADG